MIFKKKQKQKTKQIFCQGSPSSRQNISLIIGFLIIFIFDSRRHFLTMNFGHKCLSSDYHRRLLPPFKENPPILPNTRLNARRAPNTQLDLCPQMLTMRYKNSFVPYFVSQFNNWFNFVIMFIPLHLFYHCNISDVLMLACVLF